MKYAIQPGTSARWKCDPCDDAAARALAGACGIETATARILMARGLCEPQQVRRFLQPSLADLFDPLSMHGVKAAVDRILQAVRNREKILIYGDYDVDGTTSVVILKKAIELAGGEAIFHVPHRLKDGYGMRSEVMERAAAEGVKVVVSVDTGIRAADAVKRGGELGIDVIVTDHHLPESELPPALAVINPNQPDCCYPEKSLCGVGVVFKLVQALLSTLPWPEARLRKTLESFLKLVAIGTVADVVPLVGENRVIVKHGLAGLTVVRNPGLKALLDVAGITEGSTPSAEQVAFRIAPRINAAGRMATANDVIELFLTNDETRARQLAGMLHDLNADRRQTELDIVNLILEQCQQAPVTNDNGALVFAGEGWHRGVLGIVASRLVERFHRPAMVLGIENGLAQGSGRSIASFHLLNALESMSDLFVKFGGHEHAAGFTLASDRVPEFRERLNRYALNLLTPADFVPQLEIDAVVDLAELTPRAVAEILSLAPFGHGNPVPVLVCRGAEIAGDPAVMKEKHLRLVFKQGAKTLMMKAWNQADRIADYTRGRRVDIAFRIEEDSFFSATQGLPGWVFVLEDVRPAQS